MKSFNSRTVKFERYGDEELKKRCPRVEKMAEYLENRGVEVAYGTHH